MMTVDAKRNRSRPKLKLRDLVKEDMARNQMTTEMAEDRKHRHTVMIQASSITKCRGGKGSINYIFLRFFHNLPDSRCVVPVTSSFF